ncbi:hypothetical protein ACET3X_004744 [Alternaria dauci]|uniref:Uncharacterized protein n=1 Tax=Alternaria dauci TaxID=48095 RepID=A0ABR3UKR6_9PLEO
MNDNSVVSNTRTVGSASSNNTTKRNDTPDYELKKRKTQLYNLRAGLAPEGYISVYMSNSTAATFCESEMKQDLDGSPKARELKSKNKSSTREPEEDTQEITSSVISPTDTESSNLDVSTSHTPKPKSKTFSVENPQDAIADPELSPTPKATPLALTASTTQDSTEEDIFTISSMNTWYPYISQYLKTAEGSVPTADNTNQDSITTIASVNGAARLGRRGTSTVTEKSASTKRTTTSESETMQYTSDYSWLGTGTVSAPRVSGSSGVVVTATRNAAGKRVRSPFAWWRRGDEGRATDVVGARMGRGGVVEEAGQEKDEFFNIFVDEEVDEVVAETTGVGAEASGTEEVVIATKLAIKHHNGDDDDENGSIEEGKQFGLKEETLADKEATGDEDTVPDKAAKEDGDGNKESAFKDEEDDATPTGETSTDANDNPPSTKKKPAKDKEPTQTHDADDNTPADDDDTEKPEKETPTRSSKHHKPTPSNTHETSSPSPSAKPKPKPHIPSLAPSISFIFPQATPSLLPTPPPAPTGPDTYFDLDGRQWDYESSPGDGWAGLLA